MNKYLRKAFGSAPKISVIEEIAAERRRQIEKEGWTLQHDDGHTQGELALAAAAYAGHAGEAMSCRLSYSGKSLNKMTAARWPWRSWWKPKNPRRDLIRAAALIAAEIERLDRAAKG